MATENINYDRITFTLPSTMNNALDSLKNEFKQSKSEIIKLAIKSYIEKQNKLKLQKAVKMMADEYEKNDQLIELTALDSEHFL